MTSLTYELGDIVTGRFSCEPEQRRVSGRVHTRYTENNGRAGFLADYVGEPRPGHGTGVWGYDDQIESVDRQEPDV